MERTADGRIWSEVNPHLTQFALIAVNNAVRKSEGGDTVTHHAADFVHALKNCNSVSERGKFNGYRNSCGARADNRDSLPGVGSFFQNNFVKVGI